MASNTDWGVPSNSITLPPFAGPDDSQIVLGLADDELPDCMQAYYAGAVVFLPINSTGKWKWFMAVDKTPSAVTTSVDFGWYYDDGVDCCFIVTQRHRATDSTPFLQLFTYLGLPQAPIGALPSGYTDVQFNMNFPAGADFQFGTVDYPFRFNDEARFDGPIERNNVPAGLIVDTDSGSGTLTLTTAEQVIPNLGFTLTSTEDNARWEVTASCDVNITTAGAGSADIRLYVGGVLEPPRIFCRSDTSIARMTGAKTWTGTLGAAGNYTFEFRALKSAAAPTIVIQSTHTIASGKIIE